MTRALALSAVLLASMILGCSSTGSANKSAEGAISVAPKATTNAEVPLLGPEGGPQTLFTRELFWFDDLGEMTATADVVVVTRTVSVGPGRVLRFDDGDEVSLTDVVLTVEDVWLGEVGTREIHLELGSHFTGIDGARPPRWLETGRTSILFLLTRDARAGLYEPLNTQSVFRVEPAFNDVFGTVEHDSFVEDIAALRDDALRQRIADLVPRIERGEIKPQPVALPER